MAHLSADLGTLPNCLQVPDVAFQELQGLHQPQHLVSHQPHLQSLCFLPLGCSWAGHQQTCLQHWGKVKAEHHPDFKQVALGLGQARLKQVQVQAGKVLVHTLRKI